MSQKHMLSNGASFCPWSHYMHEPSVWTMLSYQYATFARKVYIQESQPRLHSTD